MYCIVLHFAAAGAAYNASKASPRQHGKLNGSSVQQGYSFVSNTVCFWQSSPSKHEKQSNLRMLTCVHMGMLTWGHVDMFTWGHTAPDIFFVCMCLKMARCGHLSHQHPGVTHKTCHVHLLYHNQNEPEKSLLRISRPCGKFDCNAFNPQCSQTGDSPSD